MINGATPSSFTNIKIYFTAMVCPARALFFLSGVRCQVSGVTCPLSCVTQPKNINGHSNPLEVYQIVSEQEIEQIGS